MHIIVIDILERPDQVMDLEFMYTPTLFFGKSH